MRFAVPALVATVALLAPTQAWACRQLIPSAKLRISDVVVDATAHCLESSGVCKLEIARVIKGDPTLSNAVMEIRVDDAPPSPSEGDPIIVARCPQTFEPWQETTQGRFYLRGSAETGFYAAHPIDAQEEAAE